MPKKQMLIVDDNDSLRAALQTVFEDDFELEFAASGEEALVKYRQSIPQVVLMDYKMPGIDGLETLQRMHAQLEGSPVVLMSAYDEAPVVNRALECGATDFIGKPFDVSRMRRVIDQAIRQFHNRLGVQTSAAPAPKENLPQPHITQAEVDELIDQTLRMACV
jgi:DNA-binding NtrC family response regulator